MGREDGHLCGWLRVRSVCRGGPRGLNGAPPASLAVQPDQGAWVRRVALDVGEPGPQGGFSGVLWCSMWMRVGLALPLTSPTLLFLSALWRLPSLDSQGPPSV